MDSLTHFHSKNVYFYVHHSYSLKVTGALYFSHFYGLTPTLSRFQWSLKFEQQIKKFHIYANNERFDYFSLLHC